MKNRKESNLEIVKLLTKFFNENEGIRFNQALEMIFPSEASDFFYEESEKTLLRFKSALNKHLLKKNFNTRIAELIQELEEFEDSQKESACESSKEHKDQFEKIFGYSFRNFINKTK